MNKTASAVRSLLLATDDALYAALADAREGRGKVEVWGSTVGPPPAGRWKPPEDRGQVQALWHVPRGLA